jgi:hypothetical protein
MQCYAALARLRPRLMPKTFLVPTAAMSTAAEPVRKAMPSALTFDRHAKCSVRLRSEF